MDAAIPKEWLSDLTPPQREAVLHGEGPLLVLAGPGSGKTRVITRRAACLSLATGRPDQILAITFTNKAAREMAERMVELGLEPAPISGTFHRFCATVLRRHAREAGIARDFAIFDREDRRRVIQSAVESAGLQAAHFPPARVEQLISRAKNALITAKAFESENSDFQGRTLSRIYQAYELEMARQHALDFDDLLMKVAQLLAADEEVRSSLEDRHPFVLIDEYQDTNLAQYRIAHLLTRDRRNLCVTGDPDQSIYRWRGADIRNILAFEQDYPEARIVRLERNYRSTGHILSCAAGLIRRNRRRHEKELWSDKPQGHAVRVVEHESGEEEAVWIARDIAARIQEGATPGGMAILYRVNAQSRLLEEALLRTGQAYQIARGTEFYARREIKDALAYLRLLLNPHDEVSLERIVNVPPRGIGQMTASRLLAELRRREACFAELAVEGADLAWLGRSHAAVARFAELLRELAEKLDQPPHQALQDILAWSGLTAHYAEEGESISEPSRNLLELVSAAAEFAAANHGAGLRDWLEYASLLSDVDDMTEGDSRVTLMTLHAAKGLEFPIVYLSGLEEGLLPLQQDLQTPLDQDELEEERRLLFVGMTRAMERLTLSAARYRTLYGRAERRRLSPFVHELPHEPVERVVLTESGPTRGIGRPRELSPEWEGVGVGAFVRHRDYGLGRITGCHRGNRLTRVHVEFRDRSRRTLILEYSDMAPVDPYDLGDLELDWGDASE